MHRFIRAIDEAIKYFVQDLQVRLPLAMLFITTLPEAMEERVQEAAIVGSAITAATYNSLDCTTVVVNGVTYSQCGITWYQPSYSGGDVTYVVVNPPPGY